MFFWNYLALTMIINRELTDLEHVKPLLMNIQYLPIALKIKFQLLSMAWKALHDPALTTSTTSF